MNKGTVKLLHRMYGIILAAFIVVAGFCLIAGCLSIYDSGAGEYSREAVATAFSRISVPVYICLALVLVGVFLPQFDDRAKKDASAALTLLSAKKDASGDKALYDAIMTERKKRKKLAVALAVVSAVSGIVFLVYALNPEHFDMDINSSLIDAMKWLLPCLAVVFAFALFVFYSNKKSIKSEVALLKTAPNRANDETAPEKPCSISENALKLIRAALVLVAAVMTVFGYFSGGFEDVLTKAVNICTECIGLG